MIRVIDSGQVGALVLLDVSAAFNTVDYQIMFDVLNHRFDIRDAALTWFHSYFNERSQVVNVGSNESNVMKLSTGVPQGSVLDPKSFVFFPAFTLRPFSFIPSFHFLTFSNNNSLFPQSEQDHPHKAIP